MRQPREMNEKWMKLAHDFTKDLHVACAKAGGKGLDGETILSAVASLTSVITAMNLMQHAPIGPTLLEQLKQSPYDRAVEIIESGKFD
jgi:hypothetical protein